MTETKLLRKESLGPLLQRLRQGGRRIVAPCQAGQTNTVWFREVDGDEQIDLERFTVASAKSVVFPIVEEILKFKTIGRQVTIQNGTPRVESTVVVGLRPCDARGLEVLDAVFLGEPQDLFFRKRREATTLITLSCSKADENCFCTSVGGGPGDTRGSDLLLTPVQDDRFLVEVLTPKGAQIVEVGAELFEAVEADATQVPNKERFLASVPVRFSLSDVEAKLPRLFDREEFWHEQSLACLGCSTCAFVCPACSCFDIQDEGALHGGRRLRCWDSCGQKLFTLHASGHNPRSIQSQRWRQRIMHKFSYLPDRSRITPDAAGRPGVFGCVGCGRCSRACPAGMNIIERLTAIAEAEL
ncbi:MAG TPA: 4Fe-4S dicluster domain-containing protein [Acidobacteriota bacterium]|nr:4Fe-4S dicluster domain-containing protein [Acidobacteriota bacterium]